MGGGGSKARSKLYQESNTLLVNKSTVDVVNHDLTEMLIETSMEAAKSCVGSIIQGQDMEIGDLNFIGAKDSTIDISQAQQSRLNFDCVQSSTLRNDIAQKMVSEIMQKMETNVDQNILETLNAKSSTTSGTGGSAVPWGKADAETDVEQINNFMSVTENNKRIENIVKKSVEYNFSTSDVQECISKIVQNQKLKVGNVNVIDSQGINVPIAQRQAADLIANCTQMSEASNKVVTDLMNFYDIKTVDDTKLTKETSMTAETETKAKKKGVIEDVLGEDGIGGAIGSAARGIGDGIGNIFKGLIPDFGGEGTGQYISIASCACICCIIILVGLFYVMQFM